MEGICLVRFLRGPSHCPQLGQAAPQPGLVCGLTALASLSGEVELC